MLYKTKNKHFRFKLQLKQFCMKCFILICFKINFMWRLISHSKIKQLLFLDYYFYTKKNNTWKTLIFYTKKKNFGNGPICQRNITGETLGLKKNTSKIFSVIYSLRFLHSLIPNRFNKTFSSVCDKKQKNYCICMINNHI